MSSIDDTDSFGCTSNPSFALARVKRIQDLLETVPMDAFAISDMHLERRTLREIPRLNESFDVLICAGDIWEGQPQNAIQSVVELARGKPAIVVPGNHDLYTGIAGQRTIAEHITLMRDDAYRSFAHWWAPAFYVSDVLKTLPQHLQPDVWICGHVHAPYDARCGRTRLVCNPVEGKQFNPDLLIRI